jgi:thiol-disulfide isomerase/thioredoxin
MDRLHALKVCAVVVALAACGEGAKSAPLAPRFEAVTAKPAADPLAELCDVKFAAGQGPVLTLPTLDKPPTEGSAGGAQWINLWATWCEPCVEELPMIERWRHKLGGEGTTVRVDLVSVDATAELVAEFKAQHPGLPATERIADPATLTTYVAALGLDATAGLPVHAFAGPDGKLRCVRSGAVLESHYDVIATLFR